MQHGLLRIASERGVGLDPAIRALARELLAARETALDLQLTLAELVAGLDGTRPDALFRLQGLDRLTQALGDLAAFTDAVADAVPRSCRIDAAAAASGLHLRDVAARLGAAGTPCVAVAPDPEDDFLL